jgi:NAD(P)-dependent dehydrogenase (short-subunit alcohol dehydrogenase family)
MSPLTFDGDVIIVTGAGGGMGRAHALELARRGARVVVNDLGGSPFGAGADPALAHAVVDEIRSTGGQAVANTESVATEAGGESLTRMAIETWGRLDAVVSNAGITQATPFEQTTTDEFDALVGVKLRGTFFVLRPAFAAMKEGRGGRIVAVTSLAGLLGSSQRASYAAANAGVIGLIRSIALEGAPHNIKANLLNPGAVGTRMTTALAERQGDASSSTPRSPHVERLLAPERVSPMVAALVHPTCRCTSEILNAWAGVYGRSNVMINDGWNGGVSATAEDVVDHWHAVTSLATAADPIPDAYGYSAALFERLFGT